LLFASLFESALLLGVTFAIARRGTPERIASASVFAGIVAIFGFLCLQSLPLSLNAILVCVFGLIGVSRGGGRGSFVAGSLIATALAYGLLTPIAIRDVQEWRCLKEEFPFESLADRLVHEKRQGSEADAASPDIAAKKVGRLEEHLAALEKRFDAKDGVGDRVGTNGLMRVRSLEHLHSSSVRQFIDSSGFGPMRMISIPRPMWITLRESEPLPLPAPGRHRSTRAAEKNETPSSSEPTLGRDSVESSTRDSLRDLHWDGLVDFANPKRFGYVRDLDHVAGFRPHEFSEMPWSKEELGESIIWNWLVFSNTTSRWSISLSISRG
jgi:hypothetical protein